MTNNEENPCKYGLTPECFAKDPVFFRRALAFRMLLMFVPKALTKKLITFLSVKIPDIETLPVDFPDPPGEDDETAESDGPTDNDAGETPTEVSAGIPENGVDSDTPIIDMSNPASDPTSPVSPVSSSTSEPVQDPWFFDTFTSLDLTYWEKYLDGASTITLDTGKIVFVSGSGEYCILRTIAVNDTVPENFSLTIDCQLYNDDSGTNDFYIEFRTGSHVIKLTLQPPGHIVFSATTGNGGTELDVSSFVGTDEKWRIDYVDGECSLYRNGDLLASGQHMQHSASGPGKLYFSCDDNLDAFLYEVQVMEN